MIENAAVTKAEVVAAEEVETVAPTPKDAEVLAEYPPFQRALEIFSIAGFALITAFITYRLLSAAEGAEYWLIGAAAFVGYVCADFASGLVHWGFDTWGSIYTPVLGKNFIRPFREHHFDEKAITRHDFIETNGNNCLVSLPVLGIAAALPLHHGNWFFLFVAGVMLFTCVGVLGTNQFHKWSHEDQPPKFVATLQKWHLILPVDHHQIHHTAPYESHYCITTGWLNGPLRAIGFFRFLERIITSVTGAVPRKDDLA